MLKTFEKNFLHHSTKQYTLGIWQYVVLILYIKLIIYEGIKIGKKHAR